MALIGNYMKVTLRSIAKFRLQNLFSLLGISIGLVLSVLSLYWLKYESAYDTHIQDSDRIYQVIYKDTNGNGLVRNRFHYRFLEDVYKNIPEIEGYCVAKPSGHQYLYPENPDKRTVVRVLETDANFFTLLDVRFIEGSKPEVFDQHTIVITESVAKQLFGRTDVVGEKMTNQMDDYADVYRIVGVCRDNPVNTTIKYGALVPKNGWMNGMDFYSYILLPGRIDKKNFLAKFNEVSQKIEPGVLDIVPLRQAKYLITGGSYWKAYSLLIAVAASSLLLLVCTFVNFYIVTLTKFMQRIRECVFHRQSGAGSGHIYALFYMEIGLLIFFSFLMCFLLIELLSGPYFDITRISLNTPDFYRFAGKAALMFWLTALLVQSGGIRYVSRLSRLQTTSMRPIARRTNRNVLFFQLLISAVFLFALAVVFLQFRYMIRKPTGFVTDQVVMLRLDPLLKVNHEALINDLKAGSVILDAMDQTFVIYEDNQQTIASDNIEGLEGIQKDVQLADVTIKKEASSFFGFQLVAGRFAERVQSPVETMLNEEAVRQLGLEDPVGKTFQAYGSSYVIVGVIKDYLSRPLSSPVVPIVYSLYKPDPYFVPYTAYVKYEPSKREEALRYIAEVCKRYSPEYNINRMVQPMDVYIRSFYEKESIVLKLLSLVTGACLLITLWGIYSVVSFTLRQQRKSIAIRKIMGAGRRGILKMYLKQYAFLVGIACTAAVVICYPFAAKWLELYAFRIQVNAPVFGVVYVVVGGVVLAIAAGLVRRALNDNPADVVKENS